MNKMIIEMHEDWIVWVRVHLSLSDCLYVCGHSCMQSKQ